MPDARMLADEIAQLPVRPGIGMRILPLLNDPRSSARDLGRLIETDPALTAQVIRLANTAFYGVSGRIGSAWRAVTVLGHSTVRAVSASAVFGLLDESGERLPEGFWPRSTLSAAAAMVLAREAGVSPEDAFSTGLLLDIGQALMFRRHEDRYAELLELCATRDVALMTAEREMFGVTHADVGAAALHAMRFPDAMVAAVRDHHRLPGVGQPAFTRVMIGAATLADCLQGGMAESYVPVDRAFDALNISMARLPDLGVEASTMVRDLSGFLAGVS